MSSVPAHGVDRVRISEQRAVPIPAALADRLGIEPGDEVRVEISEGRIVLSREESPAERRDRVAARIAGRAGVYEGYLDWLRDRHPEPVEDFLLDVD
jgi:AbrB family looped-hinge helix DNA binding protein